MDDVTFLICVCSTALHNRHAQENNVQRKKHFAELTG